MAFPLVRFAPSPTGRLHVGNARAGLINWLFARKHGGGFMLRLDDTDRERSRPEFARGIEDDLRWLGLDWDVFARQSDRLAEYEAAKARLVAGGRLYPCYETPEELDLKRKLALAAGRPPVYDRAALRLSDADRARLEGEGRKPHWRFRLEPGEVAWVDLARGPQHVDMNSQSDPVLVRGDGQFLYQLSSVVDDIAFGVTHVIRGEDHVTNTASQIQMFRALGGEPPAFAHLPLLLGADGQGLSKRLGSMSLADYRAAGVEPLALAAKLARLGTGAAAEPVASLQPLVDGLDLGHVGRAAARFSEDELWALNARTLHALPFDAVRNRLAALHPAFSAAQAAELWDAVRGNLAKLADAAGWATVASGEIDPVVEDPALLAQAADLLPPEPWDRATWKPFAAAVGAASGRKGRALFHPLRLALTARDSGPELAALLPLMGRARAEARLRGRRA